MIAVLLLLYGAATVVATTCVREGCVGGVWGEGLFGLVHTSKDVRSTITGGR